MKGIIEENGNIYCANCKKFICSNQTNTDNFCKDCGNPLSIFAIEETEKNAQEQTRKTIRSLNELANQNPSLTGKELLNLFIENL